MRRRLSFKIHRNEDTLTPSGKKYTLCRFSIFSCLTIDYRLLKPSTNKCRVIDNMRKVTFCEKNWPLCLLYMSVMALQNQFCQKLVYDGFAKHCLFFKYYLSEVNHEIFCSFLSFLSQLGNTYDPFSETLSLILTSSDL
jgi:hypothetical protein